MIAFRKFSIALLTVLLFGFSVASAQEKDASIMTFDEYAKVRHGYPYIVELQEGAPNSVAELEKSCLWLSPQLKDWRTVEQSWYDPVASHAYTNQISRLSSEFRDLHMVKLLIDEVKQGKRVFAVVGGSHVVMQERELKAISSGAREK